MTNERKKERILSLIAELAETTGRIGCKLLHKQDGRIRLQDKVNRIVFSDILTYVPEQLDIF